MSLGLILTTSHMLDANAAACDWDNPKELAENGHFDGESENWQDLVRHNHYALFDIYENYQTSVAYPAGTRHLIGMDFAGDNFEVLTERYEAASGYARSVCDRELHDIVAYKYFRILNESGYYSALLDFVNRFPRQIISETDKEKIEIRAKFESVLTAKNGAPLILKNVSKKSFPNRLTIETKANGRDSNLIFDTGGDTTSYGEQFGQKAKFFISEFETKHKTSVERIYTTKLGFIDTLKLGSISLKNVHVSLTPFKPNEFWCDGKNKENFDGLLGFDEIKKLGDRISFAVKNDRVDHIIIENYSPDETIIDENSDIETKIILGAHASKPYVNLKIEGQSYACLWDTGWDVTTLSKTMYDKHADVITPKVPASNTITGRLEQAVVAGKSLPHDIRFMDTSRESFCVVGLNAMIEAGGATWDVKNARLNFGPPNLN